MGFFFPRGFFSWGIKKKKKNTSPLFLSFALRKAKVGQPLLLALYNADVLDKGNFLEAVGKLPAEHRGSSLASRLGLEKKVVGRDENAVASAVGEVPLEGLDALGQDASASRREGVAELLLEKGDISRVVQGGERRSCAGGGGADGEGGVPRCGRCRVGVHGRHVHPQLDELHDDGLATCGRSHANNRRAKGYLGSGVGSRQGDESRHVLRVDVPRAACELISTACSLSHSRRSWQEVVRLKVKGLGPGV